MSRAKIVAALLLLLLVLVIIIQNAAPVETRLLFWTFSMPRWVLLSVTALVGFFLGVIGALVFARR